MVSVVDTVLTRLAEQVSAAIPGLNCYAYWADSVEVPCFIILPAAVDASDQVMGANPTLAEHNFEGLAAVSMAGSLEQPQKDLAVLTDKAGPHSIVRAMLADRKLGGASIAIFCDNWDREDIEPINGVEYLGQRLSFRVWVE